MRFMHKLLSASVLLASVQTAFATSAQWVNVTDAAKDPSGFHTWDLQLTLTGSDDFLSARLHATGTFYQDALGTDNSAPNPAFFVAFPQLQFDTYVASPTASSATVLGSFDGSTEGPPPDTFSTSELGIVWGDTVSSPPGTSTIAQLTFSGTAPQVAGRVSFGPDANNIQNLVLPQIVPEPAALGLAIFGATSLLRRKRT